MQYKIMQGYKLLELKSLVFTMKNCYNRILFRQFKVCVQNWFLAFVLKNSECGEF